MVRLKIQDLEKMVVVATERHNNADIKEILSQLEDNDQSKLIKKLIDPVLSGSMLPVSISEFENPKKKKTQKQPSIPEPRFNLSMAYLRALETATTIQRSNLELFLQNNGIDIGFLNDPDIDLMWQQAENMANKRLQDNSLYRPRYRKCQKNHCNLCKDGQGHGPYWYRVFRDGNKVRTVYVGKELPFESVGFCNPDERFAFLLAESLKELKTGPPLRP